jgi:hypothetical protein
MFMSAAAHKDSCMEKGDMKAKAETTSFVDVTKRASLSPRSAFLRHSLFLLCSFWGVACGSNGQQTAPGAATAGMSGSTSSGSSNGASSGSNSGATSGRLSGSGAASGGSGGSGSGSVGADASTPMNSSDASADVTTGTPAVPYNGARQSNVVIGNVFLTQPGAIAFVSNDQAGVLMQVGWSGTPGTAAPDGSINKISFSQGGANVTFDWARTGNAIAARLSADNAITFALQLIPSWSSFTTTYAGTADGAVGTGMVAQGSPVTWTLKASPSPMTGIFVQDPTRLNAAIQAGQPVQESGATAGALLFALQPGTEVQIVAGFDGLVSFAAVDGAIQQGDTAYTARRITATGDWGDFAGAIADNMNNTRLYSSATHQVAHTVSRTFSQTNPDYPVFFCWDSFFTGLLASLEDPVTGEDTVRGILSFQTPEGLVPNYGGWNSAGNTSTDRSQPPVGSLAAWKIYQRWHDMAFLAEVYPMLVKWHDWWPTARDGNKNGLLEWGTSTGVFQNAQYETGWDDNVEYAGGAMVGNNMNVDAVDLSSLWAMDAEYLTAMAKVLGNTADAVRFQADHDNMVNLINTLLWNDALGIYCSRPWSPVNGNVFFTRVTPMNFYPLIAGVPDATRAASVLNVMTSMNFWGGGADAAGVGGDLILPTVAYDDPVWPQQTYWHGTIWGPVNYLVFQGVKRYATPELQAEYARRSVSLFMTNWTQQGLCCENYLSTTGLVGGNPHYTWGALLDLIGIEAAADFGISDPEGAPIAGKGLTANFNLANIPFGGKLYDINVSGGSATVSPE